MKKLSLFVGKSLFVLVVCTVFFSCDKEGELIPYFSMAKVAKCERGSVRTHMSYQNESVSLFEMYDNDALVSSSNVKYTPSGISCTINGVRYDIVLANTRGVSRIESLTASNGGVIIYSVEYWFDIENRLEKARVNGSTIGDPNRPESVWVSYKYEGNSITTSDGGSLVLGDADNLGYVCNVLDFADSPLTSTYVINPDLYFLNLYGTPIAKLPQGVGNVTYSSDNQKLLSVGKYSYSY